MILDNRNNSQPAGGLIGSTRAGEAGFIGTQDTQPVTCRQHSLGIKITGSRQEVGRISTNHSRQQKPGPDRPGPGRQG